MKLYRHTKDIGLVCRRYHISKVPLMRWNKAYDGTRESLTDKPHRPHSRHPNAHTDEELSWIQNYHRRNLNIGVCELYGRLRQEKAYSSHPGSLYRGWDIERGRNPQRRKHLGNYETPVELGKKRQMDVKYMPKACCAGTDGEKSIYDDR